MAELIVPLKQIEYGIYGDLIIMYPKAIFYLLKGGYRVSKVEGPKP